VKEFSTRKSGFMGAQRAKDPHAGSKRGMRVFLD